MASNSREILLIKNHCSVKWLPLHLKVVNVPVRDTCEAVQEHEKQLAICWGEGTLYAPWEVLYLGNLRTGNNGNVSMAQFLKYRTWASYHHQLLLCREGPSSPLPERYRRDQQMRQLSWVLWELRVPEHFFKCSSGSADLNVVREGTGPWTVRPPRLPLPRDYRATHTPHHHVTTTVREVCVMPDFRLVSGVVLLFTLHYLR